MRSLHLLSLALLSLVIGCGSSGGGGSGKASTVGAITSAAPSRSATCTAATSPACRRRPPPRARSAWPRTTSPSRTCGTAPAPRRDRAAARRRLLAGAGRGAVPRRAALGGWAIEVVSVAEVASDAYEVGYVVTRPTGAATGTITNPCDFVAVNRTGSQVTTPTVTSRRRP